MGAETTVKDFLPVRREIWESAAGNQIEIEIDAFGRAFVTIELLSSMMSLCGARRVSFVEGSRRP